MTTITINHEQFTVRNTTIEETCPEDSWAKLMYYLHCVECVINYEFPKNILNMMNTKTLHLMQTYTLISQMLFILSLIQN